MAEISNYMQMALEEAVFSIGVSRPNPAVGAVVVKDGIVVGKGRTQRPGSAHAEVMALRDAGELARGAAIYVTLEPCCHYGRTPPCTKAIIDAGIAKVFYAHGDPNPVVRGNSCKILEEAGIEVYEGVDACIRAEVDEGWDDSEGECHCLSASHLHENATCHPLEHSGVIPSEEPQGSESRNLAFFSKAAIDAGREVFHDIERYFEAYDYFVRNKRTFVEVKSAITDEGSMGYVLPDGSHKPMKITGEGANCWNHELRAISDAILVGAGTVLADNPSLNVRLAAGNDPVKIVWAGHHEFSAEEVATLNVFGLYRSERSDAESSDFPVIRALVFSCVPQPAIPNAVVLTKSTFADCWNEMLDHLSALGMHRLMVEPGAGLAKQLFADAASAGDCPQKTLWNRLDIWKSTDCRIDDAIADLAASGNIKEGLEFPELPKNIVAKESFMAGRDVLTVYYPA
ncbi:MAG: bifunctional diaminohydroxyphosphoribosylaminopyrimidine deaminase/5-amino-6-(5-phosphoribosylamino)uracil reductase RibD [Fibrobacter sp.]|nr:bifunctional diaminohydroxyphosphoribosylaminopyrimidine deaminase/5-amino-6-(5-phosphoribosylamino)uracil reductase RibD [Fibrobacter sp.]